jgi:hypothetical protein
MRSDSSRFDMQWRAAGGLSSCAGRVRGARHARPASGLPCTASPMPMRRAKKPLRSMRRFTARARPDDRASLAARRAREHGQDRPERGGPPAASPGPPKLAQTIFCAFPDFPGVSFKLRILGLAGIVLHRDRFVADVLHAMASSGYRMKPSGDAPSARPDSFSKRR